MHKQFNVAPLSAIGFEGVRWRSWEKIFCSILIVLIVSPILSGPQCLGLPYWLLHLFLSRVTSSWCPSFLDWHVTLLWLISTQYPWVKQYPLASRMCFPLTHLGGLSGGVSGTLVFLRLLIFMVAWWSYWVKLAMVTVRSAMVLIWVIIVSVSAATAVAKLIRELWVSSSVSQRLFAPWYPADLMENFWFLLYLRCAAWKCACKFPRFFRCVPYFPTCHSHRKIVRYCTQ